MTNNKNNYASELNDPQGIDRSLLEYLKPKSEDRYSKLEAYCDLLTRATSGTYSTSVVVGNLKILPGSLLPPYLSLRGNGSGNVQQSVSS